MALLDDLSGAAKRHRDAILARIKRIRKRHWAYSTVLPIASSDGDHAAAAKWVMRDLAETLHAHADTFDPDPAIAAYRAGQRSAFLHIAKSLRLDRAAVEQLTRQLEEDDDD